MTRKAVLEAGNADVWRVSTALGAALLAACGAPGGASPSAGASQSSAGGGEGGAQPGDPSCAPRSCEAARAECGSIADGCGDQLDCGACPRGQICGAREHYKCGPPTDDCRGVDVASDPGNCGACGHHCCGGSCVAGACQPVALAVAQAWPAAVAVDDTDVFWTVQSPVGAVLRAPKGGGPAVPIAPAEDMPSAIAVDSTHVYWAGANGKALRMAGKDGSGLVELASGEVGVSDVALDDTHVYWTNGVPYYGGVKRLPKAGGLPESLASDQHTPMGLALDDANVYFATWNGSTVMKVGKDGGALTQLWIADSPGAGPQYVAVDADTVFWTDVLGGGGVRKIGKDGAGAGVLAWPASGIWNSMRIAVDASHVYWANPSEGTIRRATKDGSSLEIVAGDQQGAWGIALDDACVYWTINDGAAGSVMTTAK